jgi:dienelactone hydrolase
LLTSGEKADAGPGGATERGIEFVSRVLGSLQGKPASREASVGATVSLEKPVSETGGRTRRQFEELQAWLYRRIGASTVRRAGRWADLDESSLERYEESLRPYRAALEVELGVMPYTPPPLQVMSRPLYDEPGFRGYRVTFPLSAEITCSGILCVPKGLSEGERRPAVICQHGAGGTADIAVGVGEPGLYHQFGKELAERGYVVLAPQNATFDPVMLAAAADKGYLVGRTPFGVMVLKQRRGLDFLQSLPFVDPERIGFYGLSYGGYTALWFSALEPRIAATVCAGHFNDWTPKTTAPDRGTSYMWHINREMYQWDILHRFGHAELAAMIAPRPFMVENGLMDAVSPFDWVQPEWAKVEARYRRLGIPERAQIEHFPAGHMVWANQSYRFLDRWLAARVI